MPAVYIETSIPSFYFESRTTALMVAWRESTRAWWSGHSPMYHIVTSEVVREEIRRAPARKSAQMLDLIRDVPSLEVSPAVNAVAAQYLEHKLLPADALADALHVALASYHGVPFLLTWNVRHLANANKRRHLSILNGRLGLSVPTITTPDLLFPEDDQ